MRLNISRNLTLMSKCKDLHFDIAQTEGEPIPELEAKELLSTVDGYEDFIKAVTFVSPVPVGFEDIPGGSKGYFNIAEKRIAVQ